MNNNNIRHFIIEKDECESDPCMNGGECIDELGRYFCNCTNGFFGVICESGII